MSALIYTVKVSNDSNNNTILIIALCERKKKYCAISFIHKIANSCMRIKNVKNTSTAPIQNKKAFLCTHYSNKLKKKEKNTEQTEFFQFDVPSERHLFSQFHSSAHTHI